ncbi:hypothetical protein [Paraburkholderia sediminicola]|uniref:hypothetical protein n=1 Tax=Paraburkholderia sediminicola TaxID=458836 RepID=UPI0038B7A763
MVEDFFPAAGVTLAADVFLGEEANLASMTFLVGSFEPVPVAFFPPGVFAIAIAFSPLLGKPLKNKPLETFYYSTEVSAILLTARAGASSQPASG